LIINGFRAALRLFNLMHVYPVARTHQCSAKDSRKMEDPKDMEDRKMMRRKTRFGSLEDYEKGGVEVINGTALAAFVTRSFFRAVGNRAYRRERRRRNRRSCDRCQITRCAR